MTVSEVKTVLKAARTAGLDYIHLRDKARRFSNRLQYGQSVRYDNITKYESSGNSFEVRLCADADYQAEADAAAKALTEPYIRAARLICLVSDDTEHTVLDRYYLHCHSWKQIAQDMKKSRQWINKLHNRALKIISENT